MDACFTANRELIAETNAKSPAFKKIYDQMFAFHRDQVAWFRVAEGQFDGFMSRQRL
jgi:TRAP-type mannitol/chloroaromatic compound transport system substrate-binding protein